MTKVRWNVNIGCFGSPAAPEFSASFAKVFPMLPDGRVVAGCPVGRGRTALRAVLDLVAVTELKVGGQYSRLADTYPQVLVGQEEEWAVEVPVW